MQNLEEKQMLSMVDGLDDESIVSAKVKETAALARTAQLRQDILSRQRDEVLCRVNVKVFPDLAKDPGSIILEFKVVARGGGQFVSGNVEC